MTDQSDIAQRAEILSRELIIADAHIYTPYRLLLNNEDVAVHSETGDFDYPRARAGASTSLSCVSLFQFYIKRPVTR